MATVEVLTRARMEAIEAEAIVDARIQVVGDQRQLILIKNNDVEVNVGDIRGPIGATPVLPTIPDELDWNAAGKVYGIDPPGGPGAPTLKLQAGTTVIATNVTGRAAIYFPENFGGCSAVIAQIGDTNTTSYNHLDGFPVGDHTIQCTTLLITTETYSADAFHVTLSVPPVEPAFGVLAQPVSVGGLAAVRVNWMAFGW